MKKHYVMPTFFYVKSMDKVGGTFITEVFQKDNGVFHAYSSYVQDKYEEVIGFGESFSENIAIRLSRKDLKKEWKEWEEWRSEYPVSNA